MKKLSIPTLKKFVYPLLLGAWLFVVVVAFAVMVRFVAENINKVFSVDDATTQIQSSHINTEQYRVVAIKLGYAPIEAGTMVVATPSTMPSPSPSPTETPAPTPTLTPTPVPTPAPTMEELRALARVAIFNGTKKAGLASGLKKYFTDLGYEVVKTGNSSSAIHVTELRTTDAVKTAQPLYDEIGMLISKKYAWSDMGTLVSSTGYTVEVLIGDVAPADPNAKSRGQRER